MSISRKDISVSVPFWECILASFCSSIIDTAKSHGCSEEIDEVISRISVTALRTKGLRHILRPSFKDPLAASIPLPQHLSPHQDGPPELKPLSKRLTSSSPDLSWSVEERKRLTEILLRFYEAKVLTST